MNRKLEAKLLITGANGFIGKALASYIKKITGIDENNIVKVVRRVDAHKANNYFAIGEIDQHTNWESLLQGVDTIVHLAARVHIMQDNSDNPLAEFRMTNFHGTINLADQAVKAGVRRFIYLSTIKVNGEQTINQPFYADDKVNPVDAYAISKYEAETALLKLHQQQQIEVVIIRPPLVYGPGVKGNIARLIALLKKQWPLPLAAINNKRSLVSIDNLNSLIMCCVAHKKAPGQVFLVSDGSDISTSQLLTEMSKALHCKSYLFKLPPFIFKNITTLVGKKAEYSRLTDSLQVDIGKNKKLLDWTPELSLTQAMSEYFG
ncbi:MAG: NAD-dependent epimerase/dehydratase family protein [Pseudomonadota bacterium]